MSQQKLALQGLVKGLVQGVFFRLETQKKARQLQLNGWVRNTANGHVEVCICGDEDSIRLMLEWLHRGPPRARVSSVDLASVTDPLVVDFQIVG